MRSHGTQTEHTRPTDARATPSRSPAAVSSARLSGNQYRCHSGRGGRFLEGDTLPSLSEQRGTLCRCAGPFDAFAARLFREAFGTVHAPRSAIAGPGTDAAFPRDLV